MRVGRIIKPSGKAKGGAPGALAPEPDLLIRVVFANIFRGLRAARLGGRHDGHHSREYSSSSSSADLLRRGAAVRRRRVTSRRAYRIGRAPAKRSDRNRNGPPGAAQRWLARDQTAPGWSSSTSPTGITSARGGHLEKTAPATTGSSGRGIARQLRLRDLGGFHRRDFLDRVLEFESLDLVVARLVSAWYATDQAPVAEVTSLGLVQMTPSGSGSGLRSRSV